MRAIISILERCVFICVVSTFFCSALSSDVENTDSYYDKCKEFEKEMGRPNIYYDEDNDLVMLVQICEGRSNRVLDSGMSSVGIQLKSKDPTHVNKELLKFLSEVLKIKEEYFTVTPGDNNFDRKVKIKGSAITAFDLIDKLVAALETTAREEPSALGVTGPTNHASQEAEPMIEFDWRNKSLTDNKIVS